jgi:hypothetical protein
VSRNVPIANSGRNRAGGRPTFAVTSSNYLWRIEGLLCRIRRLLELEQAGARTTQAVNDLAEIERRVGEMLAETNLRVMERATSPQEERTECVSSSSLS